MTTLAALTVTAGVMAGGCDSKSQNQQAAEPTHDAPNPTPGSNATPQTAEKASDNAMQNVGDKMKAMGQNMKDAGKSASDAIGAEKQKLQDKFKGASTTRPAMPSMPSMPSDDKR